MAGSLEAGLPFVEGQPAEEAWGTGIAGEAARENGHNIGVELAILAILPEPQEPIGPRVRDKIDERRDEGDPAERQARNSCLSPFRVQRCRIKTRRPAWNRCPLR